MAKISEWTRIWASWRRPETRIPIKAKEDPSTKEAPFAEKAVGEEEEDRELGEEEELNM